MKLASPITSRFARRVTTPILVDGNVPVQSLVSSAMLRTGANAIGLSGVVKDETPGRGTDRPEVIGQCLQGNGSSVYAAAGDVGTVGAISFWYNPSDITSNTDGIVKLNATDSVSVVDGVATWTGAGSATVRVTTPIAVDDWSLVTVALDTPVGADAVELLRVGANYSSGKLSDVRLHTNTLSQSEHNQLATLGEAALATNSYAAWWKCEEGSGDYLLDSSGNNNTATLAGHTSAVWYTGNDVPTSGLNKIGFTKAQVQRGVNTSHTTFPGCAGNANVTLEFDLTIRNTTEFILFGNTSFSRSAFYAQPTGITTTLHDGATSHSEFYIDGALQSFSNRGQLFAALAGSQTRRIKIVGMDFSAWTSVRTAYVGGGAQWLGHMRNIKVDSNSDGTWDFESELGNDNGFITANTDLVYIPRDESNKAYDVFGSPLQYTGEAPKNGQLENSYCRDFDGIDDNIWAVGSDYSSSDFIAGVTIETTDTTLQTPLAMRLNGTSAGEQGLIILNNTSPGEVTARVNGTNFTTSSYTVTDGLPHELVIRRVGTTCQLWIDGELATSGTIPSNPTSGTALITWGANNDGTSATSQYFDGKMYNLFVGSTFTDAEIVGYSTTRDVPTDVTHWLPLSDSHQDSAVNVVDPTNSGVPSGHSSSFVGLQNVFHYNAAKGSGTNQVYDADFSEAAVVSDVQLAGETWQLDSDASPVTGGSDFDLQFDALGAISSVTTAWAAAQDIPFVTGRRIVITGQAKRVSGSQNIGFARRYFDATYHVFQATGVWEDFELFLTPSATNTSELVIGGNGAGSTLQLRNLHITWEGAPNVIALADGSGLDANNNPLTYTPSPGVWPLSENTLNSNPNNAPRRDWSIGTNVLTGVGSSSVINATRVRGLVSPDGRNDAEKVIPNVGISGGGAALIYNGTKPAVSSRYTSHIYVEQDEPEVTQAIILMSGTSAGDHAQSRINFATGEMSNTLASGNFSNAEAKQPIKLGNGWIIGISADTDSSTGISTRGYPAGVTGDGIKGCVFWGPKAERGNDITAFQGFSNYDPNEPSDFTPNPPELLQYRSEFDNAYWSKSFVTVTPNSDGIADTITSDGGGTTVMSRGSVSLEAGKQYIGSVKIKKPATVGTSRFRALSGATDVFDALLSWDGTQLQVVDLLDGTVVALPEDEDGFCEVQGWGVAAESSIAVYLYPSNNNVAGQAIVVKEISLKRYHPTNPNNFFRQRTDAGKLVGIDRLTNYRQPLLGTRLSQVQKFITAKAT